MAKFHGSWTFVDRENNEKLLEIFGCPEDMHKKIIDGMTGAKSTCVWDAATKTLTTSNKVADVTNEIKMLVGESFPIGPYAPGWKAKVTEIADDVIKTRVFNPDGKDCGTMQSTVEGDTLRSLSQVKGVTAKMSLKRA